MNLKCDKCGSTDITDIVLNPPEPPKKKLMSEFAEAGGRSDYFVNTVMIYYTHRITCKDCGYSLEYTGR